VFGLIAFVLLVIAAILAWQKGDHPAAIAYAGLALLAIQSVWPWSPWAGRRP
jgi:hypothetical protein